MAAAEPFASFRDGLAVITGGGDGMGRALAIALAAEGCSVAICDVSEETMRKTVAMCESAQTGQAKVTMHLCDVSDEQQVLAFVGEVSKLHPASGRKVALFNNAGLNSDESILGDRAAWERCFNVCWGGVYLMTRAFMPMLVESSHGYIVNTSSVCGFWASMGFMSQHTAYSASKFAVKGFTEALINDLKLNAPHVRAAVVMPGHIGTSIVHNSMGTATDASLAKQRQQAAKRVRAVQNLRGTPDYAKLERTGQLKQLQNDLSSVSDEKLRRRKQEMQQAFSAGGMPSSKAAENILNGVRKGRWRILLGPDAHLIDKAVRLFPEEAYDPDFMQTVVPKVMKDMTSGRGSAASGSKL